MGARGPAPKPPDQQANKSRAAADKARMKVVTSAPAEAPELPEFMPGGADWPSETVAWWNSWTHNPLTEDYRDSDWLDLLDCALVHGRLWNGDDKAASELRHRMARHGATREDRARLRITFATANITEVREKQEVQKVEKRASAKERYGGLKAVPTDPAPF